MNRAKKSALALAAGLIVIQFIQPAKNRNSQPSANGIENTYVIPGNVQQILKASCYDCHSNNTRYPWYANIQPFGWLLANHINKGKEELNFSEFGSYSLRRQRSKLKGIGNSIRDGSMPLSSYTLMHKDATISMEEKETLLKWIKNIHQH